MNASDRSHAQVLDSSSPEACLFTRHKVCAEPLARGLSVYTRVSETLARGPSVYTRVSETLARGLSVCTRVSETLA